MIKERHFSVNNDFHTGFISKIFFIFAFIIFLLVLFIVIVGLLFPTETNGFIGLIVGLAQSSTVDMLVAFLIITLGIGVIVLFFKRQFDKLDEIAKEIEKEFQDEEEE